MSAVRFRVPTPLRDVTGGRDEVAVDAASLREALERLAQREPALASRILDDDGSLRGYVNLFLDGRDIRTLLDADPKIDAPAEIAIVPSIAGGRPDATTAGRPDATARGGDTGAEALSPEEALRYHRQLILPGIGPEGQLRLREASILIVGAGGLGSPAALYLAAAGVGRIGIVDSDAVDLSNLHRQILHDTPSLGRPKVESARERLEILNPDVEVVPVHARLDSANGLEILSGWDLVLDGSDNFPTRYLVNDACVILGVPCVSGAVFRFEGQASVYAHPEGPCYRCLFRDPPPAELVPSCSEAGVLGVLPGLVGTIQATEAMKLLLGLGEPLIGRLLLIDARRMEFRTVSVQRDPECAVCGERPTVTDLIDYEEFCGGAAAPERELGAEVPEIDVRELKAKVEAGDPIEILDVREPHEWAISNLGFAGARLVPLSELSRHLDELRTDREVVVYCRTGYRSALAVKMLRDAGVSGAVNLRGGINAWATEIDPEMPSY